jgi:DNA-directed RNA polymerase specialized sigma subunit
MGTAKAAEKELARAVKAMNEREKRIMRIVFGGFGDQHLKLE